MNFWAQSIASPFRVTPRYDAQKSQTPVSGSVVYNKMPGSFKIGKEREEERKKLRWQKAGRRHYEPAMSDELFRDTNRPSATWFIDSSKKVPVWRISSVFTEQITSKGKKREETRIRQSPVDFRPVEDWNETVAIGDVIEFIVATRGVIMLLF